MSSQKLSNYLRSCRRRSGLSQDDFAFLFGVQCGSKICRYERFSSEPGVAVALAYEMMFRIPVRELFGGLNQRVEREILKRAAMLRRKLAIANPTRRTARKLDWLQTLIERDENPPNEKQ